MRQADEVGRLVLAQERADNGIQMLQLCFGDGETRTGFGEGKYVSLLSIKSVIEMLFQSAVLYMT